MQHSLPVEQKTDLEYEKITSNVLDNKGANAGWKPEIRIASPQLPSGITGRKDFADMHDI